MILLVPKYFSFFLVTFCFAVNGTIFSWIASSLPRPPARRAAAFAIINGIGNSASIWTPFTFFQGEKPYYRTAFGIAISMQVIAALCRLAMRYLLIRENKQLERLDNKDCQLTERELAKLSRTAEVEGWRWLRREHCGKAIDIRSRQSCLTFQEVQQRSVVGCFWQQSETFTCCRDILGS